MSTPKEAEDCALLKLRRFVGVKEETMHAQKGAEMNE